MSEDQTNKTVIVEETLIDGNEEVFFGGGYEDLEPAPEKEVDDTGKTPAQILAECGVTQTELDTTFPPGYEAFKVHPNRMEIEELTRRAKEVSERQKGLRANNEERAQMPDSRELERKYAENTVDQIKITEDGPTFSFEGFLGLLEKSKEDANRSRVSEEIKQAKQAALEEVKKTIGDFIETSELEAFNADAARKIYLNKIKVHSRLTEILKYIRSQALLGRSDIEVNYLGQFDRIRLSELGFNIANKSGGRVLAYKISWD